MLTPRVGDGFCAFPSPWETTSLTTRIIPQYLSFKAIASSEKAAANPDRLRGNDGTVRNAMSLWSSRIGPVAHNIWLSVY